MVTNEEINEAFNQLRIGYRRAESGLLNEIRLTNALKNKEMELLVGETITGGNAEIRAARLRKATIELHDALEEERVNRLHNDTFIKSVQMEIDSFKWQIRNEYNMLRKMEIDRVADMDE